MTDPTRFTIWIALACWLAFMHLTYRGREASPNLMRIWWSVGCLAYVAHVIAAFQFHHAWSHSAAFEATAIQTEEVVGRRVGLGIYVNYAFTLIWIGDVVWWWVNPNHHQARATWVGPTWHGFFCFIVFNATVVFEDGPVRWLGAAGCFWIVLLWIRCGRSR
ncbi:MAG: hypothetical protein CMO80_00605 [Verrucomicrobiales bacterium]|nr:hypothetical protein [Verrucomicrobiales bacterium]|tara:strand:+ start:4077 stop:4562 length:486 start_codon:yes stop_codon:yes gene_type:complete